ncbi:MULTISPECIES: SDR family oxidoreductase [unclassified Moorena]|uniref:SDR family oxidoreductase n=1 Tax=unclassified Moorena TaxID=2683338 RepID=UPI0013C1EF09|nr:MULTISPECIES: SDR family oxidoreductase [unclassified Moorena]NEP33439.1 SDR family oxidoreductase [Moorena sp. SIO3B2]NES81709.1 SDR family oxidoreductase [Moorena sp. SIO2B7]NET67200.1 SDR family oxidoreductase [Moorena sp. SIO1G6]
MNYFDLSGKIAIVTGVLGKLGPVWSRALLDAGATVVGIDLPLAQVPRSFELLQRHYPKTRLFLERGDICDRTAIIAIRDRILTDIGIPAVIVNNAGIDQPPGPVKTYSLEEIPLEICRNVFEVNVLGAFQVTQVFGSPMVEARRGSIINIGSLYGSVSPDARFYEHLECDPPFLKPPAYGASKAALVNLTRYFATHWGPFGIRVNALSPGGVLGGQDEEFKGQFCDRVPLGRMAEFDDLLGPLVFLASDASAYVTGIELRVDGGFTVW